MHRLARRDWSTLFACPGTDPALPGTGSEVRVACRRGGLYDGSLHTRLAAQGVPVNDRGGARITGALSPLAGQVVRETHEVARLRDDFLAKHDARGWVTVRVGRGENHRVGIRLQPLLPALRHPLVQHHQRLGGQRVGQKLAIVFHGVCCLCVFWALLWFSFLCWFVLLLVLFGVL